MEMETLEYVHFLKQTFEGGYGNTSVGLFLKQTFEADTKMLFSFFKTNLG